MISQSHRCQDWSRLFRCLSCLLWMGFLTGLDLLAGSEAQRLSRIYEEAHSGYQKSPGQSTAAAVLARACFDRAESVSSKPVRIGLAKEGVEACRAALKEYPADVACHYYLGLNLGILAQAQPWRALSCIREMETEWQTCQLLEAGFDHAGPDRSLGMLYAHCPPPPLGVGSRSKARIHLARAVALAPDYPENSLQWIEFLIQRGEKEAAIEAFKMLEARIPEARQRLTGESWAATWKLWDAQIEVFRGRLIAKASPAAN